MEHWSVNDAAVAIIEKEVIPNAKVLNIDVITLANGATVVDMGIKSKGGFRAGKYFAEIGMGGLGRLRYKMQELNDYLVPGITIFVENPGVCEMASYVAATKVMWHGTTQVVSGPVRSVIGSDGFARSVSYRDANAIKTVAGVQTIEMPDEELAEAIAKACDVPVNGLYIMAARTGCMVGSVQVCARNVEQSMPTVYDRGFSMDQIIEGNAATPIICVVEDEMTAYGRVNDCLIYGQETNLTVSCEDDDIKAMLEDIPFCKNTDVYGIPFQELFSRCDNSWSNVPRDWDAPCKINFYNIKTGNSFSTGKIACDTLIESFLGNGGNVNGN